MGFENMGSYWCAHAVVSQAWPNLLEDTSGYTVAIQMMENLEKSKQGHNYQQIVMIRRLGQATLASIRFSQLAWLAEGSSYGTASHHAVFKRWSTKSPWFCMFYQGCEKQMGKDLDENVVLLGEGIWECLKEMLDLA
jgi:hypothetical protein